jgi:CheY-like chemotaxis protein
VLRILEREGHAVTIAATGKDAIAEYRRRSFDVVLMDVQMPEMNGYEATAIIREMERGTGTHINIIAMTAHALNGDRERCIEAGMDGYISKPAKPTDLLRVINDFAPTHLPV